MPDIMNLILFLVFFCGLWLLIEILSILFMMTGLELSKSRFQVISILTHTGFTTRESELIVQHPIRRRFASLLMIISYVAQATLISLLFDIFYGDEKSMLSILIAVIAVLIFIIIVSRNRSIESRFDKMAEKVLSKKLTKIDINQIEKILNLSPDFSIYEFIVDAQSSVCNKSLRETRLKDEFIQVLKIDRGSEVVDFPLAETIIRQGDRLIVYGKISSITKLIVE